MKLFDSILAQLGYKKYPTATDGGGGGLMDMLTKNHPEDFRALVRTYNEQVYIYACVYRIANTIAGIEFKYYIDVLNKGAVEPVEIPDHPARLLLKTPNEFESGYDFKEKISTHLELSGNNYMLLDEMVGNKPTALYILLSSLVKITPDPVHYIKDFRLDLGNGRERTFSTEEILHAKYLRPDSNYYGLSSTAPARKEVDTYDRATEMNRRIFVNGMNPNAVLEMEASLDPDVYKRLRKEVDQMYTGEKKAHKTMILDNGLKLKRMSLSPDELQFVEGIKLIREAICSAYGVPPALVGLLEFANYSNMTEQRQVYWQDTVIPKLTKMEGLFDRLGSRWNDTPFKGAYCKADVSDVKALRDDEKSKSETATKYFMMGVPYNLIAVALNLPVKSIEGGDIGYLPFSIMPVGSEKEKEKEKEVIPPKKEPEKSIEIKYKTWDDKMKDRKWQMAKDFRDKIRPKYESILSGYFIDQEAEVQANIRKFKKISYDQVCKGVFSFYGVIDEKVKGKIIEQKVSIDVEQILFDSENAVKKYSNNAVKVYGSTIKESAEAEIQLFDLGITFDVQNPRVQKWIKKQGLKKAVTVVETAKKGLRKQLIEGVNEGESIKKISERIGNYYKDYHSLEKYKTVRIAKTEVLAAANRGALESYNQSDVVAGKWWLNQRTARDTHARAGGDYNKQNPIPIDSNFSVGIGSGPAPGEIGVAEEDINCECTLMPAIKVG